MAADAGREVLCWAFGVGLALFAAWFILRPHGNFVVTIDRGAVRFRGKFPLAHQSALTDFVVRELPLDRRFVVVGVHRAGRWRVEVRGLDAGESQRLRNFLLERL